MDPLIPPVTDTPSPVAPTAVPPAQTEATPAQPVAAVAQPAPVAGVAVPDLVPDTALPLNVGASDPAVALLVWVLTYAVGKWAPVALRAQVRRVLPVVAVLMACALSAGVAAVQGEPVTVDVLLRGLGAAGAAVLGHSQLREALKPRAPK